MSVHKIPHESLRILLVNTLYVPYALGGAERSVRELAEGLVELGHEVCLLTLSEEGSDLPPQEVINGVRVERVELSRVWPFGDEWVSLPASRKMVWHLKEDIGLEDSSRIKIILREFKPDLINTHNIAGFTTVIWNVFSGYPLVHTIRDYYLSCLRTTLYRRDHLCERRCTDCSLLTTFRRRRMNLPDAYIGVSQRVLDVHTEARALPDQAPKHVVYNLPSSGPEISPSEEARQFKESHQFVFGFMGRPEPAKGLPLILLAMADPRLANVGLFVAGIGRSDHTEQIAHFARNHKNIYFAGRVSPHEYLESIDASLVPTQWEEPFGRVAQEARAAGLPVIASKLGGLPEVLKDYSHGLLVEKPADVNAWIDHMERVSRGSYRPTETGQSLEQRRGTEASPSVAMQYTEIYQRILTK